MDIKAYKMDGLGNDFVIIDQRDNSLELSKQQIIKICDRKFIGCDQLIIIKKNKEFDANLEFFNSDGSSSGACGNGTRCVAYLLHKENDKKEIILNASLSILKSKVLANNLVETNIGAPKLHWDEIPLIENKNTKNLGIKIFDENNKLFPKKCNVTIAKLINKNLIKVKVWERGAGLTKACGTAACATVVAGYTLGFTNKEVDIEFELGKLSISLDEKNNIHMKGPVSDIKEIDIKL